MKKFNYYFPHVLGIVFAIFWTYFAFEPFSRDVWWAENLPIMATFLFLVLTFRKYRFSNLAYFFMTFWLFWHTVGGHYSFERVPFDDVTKLIDAERNHFDRVGHFVIGFYAYPVVEYLLNKKFIQHKKTLFLFGIFAIMSLAATYEIIEWQYVVIEGGDAGASFLGSQGDIWDAQKDMLADTLGAFFALIIFFSYRWRLDKRSFFQKIFK